MLQILMALIGVLGLVNGEINLTSKRVLRSTWARIVAAGFIALALAPLFIPTIGKYLYMLFGAFCLLCVAFGFSEIRDTEAEAA